VKVVQFRGLWWVYEGDRYVAGPFATSKLAHAWLSEHSGQLDV
jgi:hypothetical protein